MKRLLIFYLISSLSVYTLAQNSIPVNKYNSKLVSDINDEFIGNVKGISHLRFLGSYSHLTFLNDNFNLNKTEDKIEHSYGMNVGFEYFFKIFKLGARYTNNNFEITDDLVTSFSSDKLQIQSQGVESKLDIMLLPQIKHFSLFVGGGYSHQWLSLEKSDSQEKKSFGEPIWNAGFDIFLSKKITVIGEYVQTIDNESVNAFNRLNIGLGYTY